MGAWLLAAGAPGKRHALPNARIMIHQPLGGAGGQATDIDIQAQEIINMKKKMTGILSKHTGRTEAQITKDIDRDYFLSAEQAKEYGIVDHIISTGKKPKKE
jgi:ATP-dependent Clp protease protease subunit